MLERIKKACTLAHSPSCIKHTCPITRVNVHHYTLCIFFGVHAESGLALTNTRIEISFMASYTFAYAQALVHTQTCTNARTSSRAIRHTPADVHTLTCTRVHEDPLRVDFNRVRDSLGCHL